MPKLVGELMTTECNVVPEGEIISEAVKKIAGRKRGKIACVVDREGKIKGVLTPSDILKMLEVSKFGGVRARIFSVPEVLHFLTSKYAKDIMSGPVSVRVNDGMEQAINTMLDHGFYELPVVDENMRVVGEISFFDILIDSLENQEI